MSIAPFLEEGRSEYTRRADNAMHTPHQALRTKERALSGGDLHEQLLDRRDQAVCEVNELPHRALYVHLELRSTGGEEHGVCKPAREGHRSDGIGARPYASGGWSEELQSWLGWRQMIGAKQYVRDEDDDEDKQ